MEVKGKIFLSFFTIALAFQSCCSKQEGKASVQNLNYCTLNYDILITHPQSFIQNYDSVIVSTILKEDFSDYKKDKIFKIGKITTLDHSMRKSLFGFMIPSEKLYFDTAGYLVKQKIMSCYDWDVNYHYEKADKSLKIHSKLEGQKGTYDGTSYYWFDHLNRINKIHRIIYKDLYCMYEHKQVLYEDTSFIPTKIYSEQKSRAGIVHERGIESFYKSKTGLDSIHIDFIKIGSKPYLEEKIMQTYHFAQNGMVQNINNGKYDVQYHYYEKKNKK